MKQYFFKTKLKSETSEAIYFKLLTATALSFMYINVWQTYNNKTVTQKVISNIFAFVGTHNGALPPFTLKYGESASELPLTTRVGCNYNPKK